jgi:hypothetical protein
MWGISSLDTECRGTQRQPCRGRLLPSAHGWNPASVLTPRMLTQHNADPAFISRSLHPLKTASTLAERDARLREPRRRCPGLQQRHRLIVRGPGARNLPPVITCAMPWSWIIWERWVRAPTPFPRGRARETGFLDLWTLRPQSYRSPGENTNPTTKGKCTTRRTTRPRLSQRVARYCQPYIFPGRGRTYTNTRLLHSGAKNERSG